jgi:hypothetical protein
MHTGVDAIAMAEDAMPPPASEGVAPSGDRATSAVHAALGGSQCEGSPLNDTSPVPANSGLAPSGNERPGTGDVGGCPAWRAMRPKDFAATA